jgi:hypothetical protein
MCCLLLELLEKFRGSANGFYTEDQKFVIRVGGIFKFDLKTDTIDSLQPLVFSNR